MTLDFVALTCSVAVGLPDVKACLIVSRDGLALGAHPEEEGERTLKKWLELASLGEVERGFVAVGDELWAFGTNGPYGGLVVTGPNARPAVALDRVDRMLGAAVEALEDDELEVAAGESRATVHFLRSVPRREPEERPASAGRDPADGVSHEKQSAPPEAEGAGEEQPAAASERPTHRLVGQSPDPPEPTVEDDRGPSMVDTISLAREFAGLLDQDFE